MDRRLKLHEELCKILGNRNVYYQPPESIKMSYPCIRYKRSGISARKANNFLYNGTDRYELIIIDSKANSRIADEIMNHFQMCSFDRFYYSDNLSHSILTLYY